MKVIADTVKTFVVDRLLPALAWLWAHIMAVVRMLWICRAAVLPVIIGVALIGWTDQARDIVVADAIPARQNWLRMFIILAAVTVWSTVAWYWARITVQYSLINPQPSKYQNWHGLLTVEVPRVVGTAGMLSVALAFWQAHKLYSYAGDLVRADRFMLFMWFYIVVAGIFYIAVRNRALIAGWLADKMRVPGLKPDRQQTDKIFDRKHPLVAALLIANLLATPVFFLVVVRSPVGMNDYFFKRCRAGDADRLRLDGAGRQLARHGVSKDQFPMVSVSIAGSSFRRSCSASFMASERCTRQRRPTGPTSAARSRTRHGVRTATSGCP